MYLLIVILIARGVSLEPVATIRFSSENKMRMVHSAWTLFTRKIQRIQFLMWAQGIIKAKVVVKKMISKRRRNAKNQAVEDAAVAVEPEPETVREGL
ncbi:hypothetical protein HanXRQr2_Chr02g0048631 [Helianthus annuus]|uniref:Secreted protein n=1 Tax=Helianthus annuus TaxID=4232 RepID=A0A9K3NZL8_HELAN|nr:hypothetical protein HanXRQr2_Chr02g0048631 [Helianthus annuus]KAJ0950419.1 hypothetical protein HanPSC8_Chr02g0048081 [Helianthus annuus]